MTKLFASLRALDRNRLILLGLSVAVVLAILVALLAQLAKPPMSLLYSGLDLAESGRIVRMLEQMDIEARADEGGTAIYVPKSKVARARMSLAEEGLPSSGVPGYELFDEQGSLGLTSFMQQVNRLRALEGELARTIHTLGDVESARVHLVLPERDAFTREQVAPSASVVVRLKTGRVLSADKARAIQSLIAASVPRLDSAAVTVLDARGDRIFAQDDTAVMGGDNGARAEAEMRIIRAVESMLAPRLGAENVRVQASVEFNRERQTIRETTYDPSATAIRSTQSVEEVETSREGSSTQPVTVQQNLPQVDVTSGDEGVNANNLERLEETTNYEVSSRLLQRVEEPGSIKRQSVAILVNGTYEVAEDGSRTYRPRSEAELAQIENLVRSAVGFDESRGDRVTVENLEFLEVVTEDMAAPSVSLMGFISENLLTILRWLAIIIAIAVISIFALRPLMAHIFSQNPGAAMGDIKAIGTRQEAGADSAAPDALDAVDAPAGIEGPAQTAQAGTQALPQPSVDERLEQMMELRAVEGKVRASSLHKLGEIVEQNPDEVVAILRSWIYEEAA
ncbi:flagellar basal-body MS-ring/collar protein FliF [Iodidimonas muriae]|uniref:flagellar basal-body MS-ring/collar protein FliF n=1 Tax=Iodidimonas muriae TaxID=261467 RepID=UPI00166E3804|nr:flagellar basal-body MS-ring/collar protein FliF [Iodidimonas muriae]